MSTADWIRDMRVIILNITMWSLYKVYIQCKSCVEQCLETLVFMFATRLNLLVSKFESSYITLVHPQVTQNDTNATCE